MDLSTIKKNLESGVIRTTAEFHRDITLMFLNSIIFNPTTDDVYRMAKEMFSETNVIIQVKQENFLFLLLLPYY